ncbi:hypothetical protein FACS1894187_18280 [Synergistales bacterium]|nr:hypothetical protein FACS1894187_18280 [Synergistales bacterium]
MSAKEQSWVEYKPRTILKDVLPLETPFSLQVEPARACNFKCVYCYHYNEREADNNKYLSVGSYRSLFESSWKFKQKLKSVTFGGKGEPLLNKGIFEMIRMTEQIAQETVLITNGSLLTQETVDNLLDSGLTTMRISLQGLDADGYYKTCGHKMDFDRFLRSIEYAHAGGEE